MIHLLRLPPVLPNHYRNKHTYDYTHVLFYMILNFLKSLNILWVLKFLRDLTIGQSLHECLFFKLLIRHSLPSIFKIIKSLGFRNVDELQKDLKILNI